VAFIERGEKPVNRSHTARSELVSWSYEAELQPVPEPGLERAVMPTRQNPRPAGRYELAIIGGGVAGLAAALAAARLGLKAALIERDAPGGAATAESSAFGCLLHAARVAHEMQIAAQRGLHEGELQVVFPAIMRRVRAARDACVEDARRRLEQSGVDLFFGDARFYDDDTLDVSGDRIPFARALIATGAQPAIPAIDGLEEAGYRTPASMFSLSELPPRLVVLGGGPTACELAQVFARLGSRVTLIEAGSRLLPEVEPRAAEILQCAFEREGITVRTGAEVVRVEALARTSSRRVSYERGLSYGHEDCDEILVAMGQAPNLATLGLSAVGIEFDKFGIQVDDFLRTSNPRVFAAGDVCSASARGAAGPAEVALNNALFWRRVRIDSLLATSCTRTDPQVAHVGVRPQEASQSKLRSLTLEFAEKPSTSPDGASTEFARLYYRGRAGRIAGATLVGPNAAGRLAEVLVALRGGITLKSIARSAKPQAAEDALLERLAEDFARQAPPSALSRWIRRMLRRQLR
jgi:pyruvate/2-oxoglutarate dehydrogenase complex dihydrolipoamide dehydrogenase (E3) component